jgi:hypothetical protein
MGKEINEYTVTAATVEAGSWFDIDQDIGGGSFQSQKLSLAILKAAIGNFYLSDGTFDEARLVTQAGFTLQFTGGQTSFGRAPTLTPLAGANVTIDFNTGNYQTIDMENATGDVTVSLTNQLIGGMYTIKIIQGAGLHNLIWPAQVKWASSQPLIVTTVDDAEDRVNLIFDNPNYHAVFASDFN